MVAWLSANEKFSIAPPPSFLFSSVTKPSTSITKADGKQEQSRIRVIAHVNIVPLGLGVFSVQTHIGMGLIADQRNAN